MPLRSFTPPDNFYQELTGDNEYEDLVLEPTDVKKLWTSAFLQRTLSRNLVFTGSVWTPMSGSSTGKQKIEVTGQAYEEYNVETYTTSGTGTETIDLGKSYDKIFVRERAGIPEMRFSLDGVTYGDWIIGVEMESFEHLATARYVQVKRSAATDLEGEVLAYR